MMMMVLESGGYGTSAHVAGLGSRSQGFAHLSEVERDIPSAL
jgi:hypothetical protein